MRITMALALVTNKPPHLGPLPRWGRGSKVFLEAVDYYFCELILFKKGVS